MKGTLLESSSSDVTKDKEGTRGLSFIAAICAVLVTGLVVGGYFYLRERHARQTFLEVKAQAGPPVEPKGPPKARILIDEAMLKGDQTIIGGTVQNISSENLTALSVELELMPRKGATSTKTSVEVQPTQLGPQEEGRYYLPLHSADYSSVKLVALRSGLSSSALVYTSAPGQKRLPEKIESKTIIVKRPSTTKDGFLNTPDTPGRVP